MLIFLGGTVGASDWRTPFMAQVQSISARYMLSDEELTVFNPVVDDWDEAAQRREDEVKRIANINLFYITNPGMGTNEVSAYSLTEAIMGLYDRSIETCVIFDTSTMSPATQKSFEKIKQDLRKRFPHGSIYESLDQFLRHLEFSVAQGFRHFTSRPKEFFDNDTV